MDGRNDRARTSSALFQSTYGTMGNFELALTDNASGPAAGSISHYWRDNDGWRRGEEGGNWSRAGALTEDHRGDEVAASGTESETSRVYRHACWLEGTDCNFHGICVCDGQVLYFGQTPSGRWRIDPLPVQLSEPSAAPSGASGAVDCIGAPAFLQSFYGSHGDFEIVVPVEGGGMKHFWSSNDQGLPHADPLSGETFNLPVWQPAGRPHFGSGNDVLGVRLLHTDQGHLVVVALEQPPGGARPHLAHYYQNTIGGDWSEPYVLEGSERVGGLPGAIVSSFGLEYGSPGNLEVVAPAESGGLLAWWRNGASGEWIRAIDVDPGGRSVRTVHLIQSTNRAEGAFHGNFEVAAETGDDPFGFGEVLFYTRAHQASSWTGPEVLSIPTS